MFVNSVTELAAMLAVLLVAFPVHELAHAWLADYFGDDTPRLYGRLTLNPLAHLDLFGSLTLLLAGFGWAKPVPVNERALEQHSQHAPALVALAGPASNLVLGFLAGIPLMLGLVPRSVSTSGEVSTLFVVIYIFSLINFVLFFFNLLPIFPLDGEKILLHLLPYEWRVKLEGLRRFSIGPLLVIALLLPRLGIPVLDWLVFEPAVRLVDLFIR